MDYGGAAKLVEAAEERGVRRYLMLSSMGADDPEGGTEAMRPYLRAKSRADERLKSSSLDYTIIRPGGLTEDGASAMIVNGFIEPLVKELPMEYAVEMNRLIQLQMEGSVG